VIENAKNHKGMKIHQKLQIKILTREQKGDFMGYEGERAASRYI
jgi:hypothetical protein